MPAALQTRLLRVLAEGEFFRVGGRELIRVDVRVIAATHQAAGGARRRRSLPRRPAAPARRGAPGACRRCARAARTFPQLAAALHGRCGETPRRCSTAATLFAPPRWQRLRAHHWPGNVRELENVCWRLAALAPGEVVTANDLADVLPEAQVAAADAGAAWLQPLDGWVRQQLQAGVEDLHAQAKVAFDRTLLQAALDHCDGHRGEAASVLGLGRNTVTRKLGASRKRR
jgi:two-component system nitrogen regulation response regulator GlnG